jgi:hypothetical protein
MHSANSWAEPKETKYENRKYAFDHAISGDLGRPVDIRRLGTTAPGLGGGRCTMSGSGRESISDRRRIRRYEERSRTWVQGLPRGPWLPSLSIAVQPGGELAGLRRQAKSGGCAQSASPGLRCPPFNLGVAFPNGLRQRGIAIEGAFVEARQGREAGTFPGHVHDPPLCNAEPGFAKRDLEHLRSHLRFLLEGTHVQCPSCRHLTNRAAAWKALSSRQRPRPQGGNSRPGPRRARRHQTPLVLRRTVVRSDRAGAHPRQKSLVWRQRRVDRGAGDRPMAEPACPGVAARAKPTIVMTPVRHQAIQEVFLGRPDALQADRP